MAMFQFLVSDNSKAILKVNMEYRLLMTIFDKTGSFESLVLNFTV
jgi:hypothetical protein